MIAVSSELTEVILKLSIPCIFYIDVFSSLQRYAFNIYAQY